MVNPVQAGLHAVTGVILVLISVADYKTMEIPDRFPVILAGCGIAAVFVFPDVKIMERMIGFFCVSVPMFLLCLAVEGAFGGGDIKLSAVMGFYLGWRACIFGAAVGVLIGGLQAAIFLASGKARYGERTHMAFGPALCAGFFLAEFCGTQIFEWYLSFFIKF